MPKLFEFLGIQPLSLLIERSLNFFKLNVFENIRFY
jgi:hypothetical protein